MSKASAKKLTSLHGALADAMAKILSEGVTAKNDEGEVVQLTPGASYLNVIRQFLKDNNVENLSVGEQMEEAQKSTFSNLPFNTSADDYGSVN